MAKIEVDLPDRIQSDIERMVQQDEFVNWDQAIDELLKQGIAAYGPAEDSTEEMDEDLFNQSIADQQDPALSEEPQDDEYGF